LERRTYISVNAHAVRAPFISTRQGGGSIPPLSLSLPLPSTYHCDFLSHTLTTLQPATRTTPRRPSYLHLRSRARRFRFRGGEKNIEGLIIVGPRAHAAAHGITSAITEGVPARRRRGRRRGGGGGGGWCKRIPN